MNSRQKLISTHKGFTILELMIVMVIVAIGVSLAVPTYQDVVQRRETTAQAQALAALVSFVQGEVVKNNQMMSVHLTYTGPKNWCLGANEGKAPCDCTETDTTAADFCSLNGVEKIVRSSDYGKLGMTAASADKTIVFDPVRGTMSADDLATSHYVRLDSDNANWALKIDFAATGRISICNPDSAKAVPGFQACS